jgi:NAD(P)H-dependent FMN reductase
VRNLLLVVHCPSENTRQLRDALIQGASHPDVSNIELRVSQPLTTQVEDVLWANGIVLGTTENFGYMSGAMKDFFDRIYYPCLEQCQGLSCAVAIRAGLDGTGTKVAMDKILTGLKWKQIREPLISKGEFQQSFLQDWEELGMTMAAGLEAGIY